MKNFKRIVALIVAILVLIPFGTMFSTSAAATNLAVNATASTGMSLLANRPVTNIIDTNPGDSGNNWAAVSYVDGLAWYQLDFATAQTVNKVLIFNNQETAFAPADLAIDVKTSNGKWTRVAEKHDLEIAPENTNKNSKYTARNFCFGAVSNVKAVRVTANKNGNSRSNNFMLVSFGVYNDSTVTSADYTGVTAGTGNRVIPSLDNEKVNLALDATATANNILDKYPANVANDGVGIAATAQNVSDAITQYANKIAYFQFDLKEASTVNNVIIYNSQHELTHRPSEYAIDVKTTDGKWTRVAETHNVTVSGDWGDSIRNFKFAPVDSVVAVRVTANGARNDKSNNFRVAEIAIFNDTTIKEADYTGVAAADDAKYAIALIDAPSGGGQQGGGSQSGSSNTNLAVNATASTSMPLLMADRFPITNIIDTNPADNGNNWAAVPYADGLAWIQLNFATAQTVNKVLIFNNQETAFAPKDYAIDVKTADGKWTRVAEKHDFEVAPAHTNKDGKYTSRTFCFAPVSNVVAIRAIANKNGNNNSNNFMVVSFAAYNDSAVTAADYTGVTAGTGNRVIPATTESAQGGGQQGGAQGGATLSENYALTGTVTLSKENAGMGKAEYANDGNTKYAGGQPYACVVMTDERGYINIKLKEPKTVNYVKVIQSPEQQNYRPMDYTVDVKFKDGTFKRVAEMHNIPTTQNTLEFKFEAQQNVYAVRVSANRARNTFTKAGENVFRAWTITEVEVYNDSAITAADYTGNTADANAAYNVPAYAKEAADLSDLVNYAAGAKVTVSKPNQNYPAERIIDGKKSYKDEMATTAYVNGVAYYEIDFGKLIAVNQVILYYTNQESTQRPVDYAVDVLLPTGKWKRVSALYNSPNPSDWGSYYREFNFETTKCFRVRVSASNLRTKRGSSFHATEIEVWNNPTVTAANFTGVQKADKAELEIAVPADVDVSTLPATGDTSFPLMTAMVVIFAIAVLGITATIVFRKKLFN